MKVQFLFVENLIESRAKLADRTEAVEVFVSRIFTDPMLKTFWRRLPADFWRPSFFFSVRWESGVKANEIKLELEYSVHNVDREMKNGKLQNSEDESDTGRELIKHSGRWNSQRSERRRSQQNGHRRLGGDEFESSGREITTKESSGSIG
jgi:hypothetical protein